MCLCRRERSQSTRKAFTLVELLVVIAIIALLISILFPAISAAREKAKQVVCGSNLRQIGVSIVGYSADNKGMIPTQWSHGPQLQTTPQATAIAFWTGGWPVVNGVRASFNFAALEMRHYINNPRVFYCPSQPFDGYQFDTYKDSWALRPDQRIANSVYIYVAYHYAPQYDFTSDMPYQRLAKYPQNKIMALDMIFGKYCVAHDRGTPGWNMLFPDGHVVYRSSRSIYNTLPDFYDGNSNNLTAFTTCITALEAP